MVKLNRPQREALARIHARIQQNWRESHPDNAENEHAAPTYRDLRRQVHPYIGGDCVLVPFCGMWLGIERDGYTHS